MLEKNISLRLTDAEDEAIALWARADDVDNRSAMIRRILRRAIREHAPRSIFPGHVITALNLDVETRS